MAGFDKIFGLNGVEVKDLSRTIIDVFFGNTAILLNDLTEILGIGVPLPIPLLGFFYLPPDSVPLLDYDYSSFPYLNREVVTNCYLKKPTQFSVIGVKPLTAFNTFALNFATSELVTLALEKYADAGGTFTIITPYKVRKRCLLRRLEGVKLHDGDIGVGWRFTFEQANFHKDVKGVKNSYLNSFTSGGF